MRKARNANFTANFSDNSDNSDHSDPAPPGCAVASSAQTMERGEGRERLSSLFLRGSGSSTAYGKMRLSIFREVQVLDLLRVWGA